MHKPRLLILDEPTSGLDPLNQQEFYHMVAYIVLAFMEELFEGTITMPVWLMNLSIFHLYGNPVFLGVNWTNFLGMTSVALVLLLIGLIQFRAADIKLG